MWYNKKPFGHHTDVVVADRNKGVHNAALCGVNIGLLGAMVGTPL